MAGPFDHIFENKDSASSSDSVPEAETQTLRTGLQGFTFGFGDEIEAGIRSVLPESLGGGEYKILRDELRTKLREYKAQYPNRALTEEVVGGILSIIPAMLIGGPAGAGARASGLLAQGAGMVGRGAAVSTAATVGYSDKDKEDLLSGAGNTISTAGDISQGTAASVAIEVGLKGLSPVGAKLFKIIKDKLGAAPANAAQEELRRIMEKTGKTIDEVVQDIRDGRTISSNEDLLAVIKALQLDTPATIQLIREGAVQQAKRTAKSLDETLVATIVPDAGARKNLFTMWRAKVEKWKEQEAKLYDELFEKTNPRVSDEIAAEMLDARIRFPGIDESLKAIYKAKKLKPLFKTRKNGEVYATRRATLEDAEILRRNLKEAATKGYTGGETSMGKLLDSAEKRVRGAIDEFSPELKATREGYRILQESAEAFTYGEKKALTGNVDEVLDNIKDYTPEQFEAFQIGVLANIRNKIGSRPGTVLKELYDETTQAGKILRVIIPEDQLDDILKKVDAARNAAFIKSKYSVGAGSITAPVQEELKKVGQGVTQAGFSGFRALSTGDPVAALGMVGNILSLISPTAKKMRPEERQRVAEIIFSEDADLVELVLKESVDYTVLLDKVGPAIERVRQALVRPAVQQAVQPTVPEETRPITPRPTPDDTLSSIAPIPGITPGPETQISAVSGPFNPETYARLFPNEGVA